MRICFYEFLSKSFSIPYPAVIRDDSSQCFNKPQIAFIDKIGKAKTLVLILLGNRHNKPEIGPGELFQSFLVTLFDPLRQFNLFLHSNQFFFTNLLQVFV